MKIVLYGNKLYWYLFSKDPGTLFTPHIIRSWGVVTRVQAVFPSIELHAAKFHLENEKKNSFHPHEKYQKHEEYSEYEAVNIWIAIECFFG